MSRACRAAVQSTLYIEITSQYTAEYNSKITDTSVTKKLDHYNSKNTTPGIRNFYAGQDKKFSRLYDDKLMDALFSVLNIWKVVNAHVELDGEPWSVNSKILQSLDILTSYPNEFWKYPVIIYYLSHHTEDGFENEFSLFLNKLLISLLTTYLIEPTINAVKSSIIKLDIAIIHSPRPQFDFKEIDAAQLESKIKNPHRNVVRMLLKILAYQEQDSLLPEKWEIEHIFPKKWQNTYFVNTPDDIVKERIEHLGNKLPFEKNLNIVAGNGYFDKKKGQYEKSGIAITRNMAHVETSEWDMDSITADPEKVQHILTRFEERVNLFPEKQIFCDNFS